MDLLHFDVPKVHVISNKIHVIIQPCSIQDFYTKKHLDISLEFLLNLHTAGYFFKHTTRKPKPPFLAAKHLEKAMVHYVKANKSVHRLRPIPYNSVLSENTVVLADMLHSVVFPAYIDTCMYHKKSPSSDDKHMYIVNIKPCIAQTKCKGWSLTRNA